MFSTIYKHELKYWFNKPAFYIYLVIFFLISILLSASSAGFFDSVTVTTGGAKIANSPISVNSSFNAMLVFLFFLFPSIIGVTLHRDFKSQMHSVLYSYPFTKFNYLLAKFLSGVTIILLIALAMAIGLALGYVLPGTNPEIVTSFDIQSYVYTFFGYIIPNTLFFGAIVFAVVLFSRNVTAGFITVVILMLIQGLMSSLVSEEENRFLSALIDPYGGQSIQFYTKYWTLAEQNENHLPFKGVVLYNRLLWSGVALLIFGFVYNKFSFSQSAIRFSFFKKKSGERFIKKNFGSIMKINLPKVTHNYSFIERLKTAWKLSNIDFKYIVKALPFIAIVLVGAIIILISLSETGMVLGTKTLPVSWKVIGYAKNSFMLSMLVITFLYTGMLIHRAKTQKTHFLIDSTPTPNWVFWFSKFLAITKVQFVLLVLIMVSGLIYQTYRGYYNYEFGQYLFKLFVLEYLVILVWTLLAFIVQTLVGNTYVGLVILLILLIGLPFIRMAGIEQSIFIYNKGGGFSFSDMNGYENLKGFFTYKTYWLLLGGIFLVFTHLLWVRGLPHSFKERISILKQRFSLKIGVLLTLLTVGFVALGARIYYENNVLHTRLSSKEREQSRVDWEKKYKKYDGKIQPRIVSVNVNLNIFPKEKDFTSSGRYVLVNKSNQLIDTLLLNHNDYLSVFKFNKSSDLVSEDTVFNFDVYKLHKALAPGDSLELAFEVKNKPNTFFRKNSPVISNGTFVHGNSLFPSFGYSSNPELTDNKTRKKYGLPKNDLKPHPTDSTALGNTYISNDSDWIDFETTVSTSKDQIAIAPGYLQKEWVEGDRRYFHYKMDSKILNFYAYNSARYEVKRDKWKDVHLEIYYQKGHEYNLDRMMDGIKASLAYNSENFSPYQHKQVRIIEFPKTNGSFAQSFPNTIPFSETIGFIADVDAKRDKGVDYPFAVTVHELAHQWWAHQVIGADVLGSTMLSESLSEYVSLKVLEHQQGKQQMRKFLKKSLDGYLRSRTFERKREKPLMYNDGQGYVRYQKGSLIFYALADFIGEDKLNGALKKYVEKVKFQAPPYTTSIEMVDEIRKVVPDSLQYTIKDMFETITLYRNKVVEVTSTELNNGKYQVDITFQVSKYRNDEKGKVVYESKLGDTLSFKDDKMKKPILSVPLADYIDIGVFGNDEVDGESKEKELYLKKHKITKINNKISIIVDEKPTEVGVDPYNKLIDTESSDNRKKIK